MLAVAALLVAAPFASAAQANPWPGRLLPAEPLAGARDERAPHLVPAPLERSKKELWLREKSRRPAVRAADVDLVPRRRRKERAKRASTPYLEAEARLAQAMPPPGSRILPITTLYNLWNREAWPLLAGRPYKRPFQLFLRDHFTHECTWADTRLATLLAASALKFHSARVEVVSGYRSPKYNLMLRKKGRQVARESQHLQGTAVDFRVRGASTEALHEFVRGLRLGGVGYYPRTRFIHADTGRVRYWSGS
ncbi:MAG: YcbK family protein [Deltaproteobacteria bacterium]|nr:YcbK family protein [Deltaproteobacteria bacterium]